MQRWLLLAILIACGQLYGIVAGQQVGSGFYTAPIASEGWEGVYVWNAWDAWPVKKEPRDDAADSGHVLAFGEKLAVTAVSWGGRIYRSKKDAGVADKKTAVLWELVWFAKNRTRNSDGWTNFASWTGDVWVEVARTRMDEQGHTHVTNILGWHKMKYLASAESLRDPNTHIHIKGFLIRSPAYLANKFQQESEASKKEVLQRVAGLKQPKDGAPKLTEVRFNLDFLHVFSATGDNPETDWVLLGRDYEFSSSSPDSNPLVGWYPLSVVEFWYTRQALQWSTHPQRRRDVPGVIFGTPQDALRFPPPVSKDQIVAPEFILAAERFLDGQPIEQTPDMPRFPILDRLEVDPSKIPDGFGLVKIGVSGGFVNEKGEPLAAAEDIQKLQQELRALLTEIQEVQILVVIDETESMAPWFPVMADALDKVITHWRSKFPDKRLGLAISYYSDDDSPNRPAFRTTQLKYLPREIDEQIRALRNHTVSRGGDPRERVFDGILKAVQDAGFTEFATKIVIVVGDDADKSNENDPRHVAESQIVNALLSYPVPINFVAVHAYPEEIRSHRPVAEAFHRQMTTICELYSRKKQNNLPKATLLTSNNVGQLFNNLPDTIAQINEQIERLRTEIKNLMLGNFSAKIQPQMERILEERGVLPIVQNLAKEEKGFQIYHTGYAWIANTHANSDKVCMEGVVLLNSRELEELYDISRSLRDELAQGKWNPDDIKKVLEKHLGEKVKNNHDLILKWTALAFEGLDWKTFLRKGMDTTAFLDLQGRVLRMRDIINDVTYDYKLVNNQWVRFGLSRRHQRWFQSFDGVTKWYWLRVRDECP